MKYENVAEGIFLSRPNRFIAKVRINGKEETVHVKNTGRCKELLIPGAKVLLEHSSNPARKTAYDLFGVYKEGLGLVNMDSQAPNKAVLEWLKKQNPTSSASYFQNVTAIKPEFTYGSSRIDFYFKENNQKCLMEVKGVTLERHGIAYFPDAPTQRGVKHIEELEAALTDGFQCYLAFVIQMPGILNVHPNGETHPAFKEALCRAAASGVHVLSLGCHITESSMNICNWKELY